MSMYPADVLDLAIARLQAGETLPAILADPPAEAAELAPLLNAAAALDLLQPVEMPDAEALASDRDRFLASLATWQPQPVSPGPLVRLKGWIVHQVPWPSPGSSIQRKEQRRMSILALKATMIFSLVFGSAGGAAAMAANSLPDSPLYPAKLAMEQARLHLAGEPAEQARLHLTLAQTRVQEMERLALAGEAPGPDTSLRLEQHLDQAFRLAAGLPEQQMLDLLAEAGPQIRHQEQQLNQVRTRAAEPAREPLGQASRLLNRAGQEVEAGLQDPQTFRWRYGEGDPPGPGGNPDCPDGNCEPAGDLHQYGPGPDQPGPGQPGGNPDCPDGNCEPAGDEHRYRPEPDQPGPGEPGGNPDGACTDCEPAGDLHQYGPQPDQPGPGEPGGNPDGACTDCEPAGDQHQYGPQPDQPGPGEPGGNPDGACTDCEPAGDQHHGTPPEPGGNEDAGSLTGQDGGNEDAGGSGGQDGGNEDHGGSDGDDGSDGEGDGGHSGGGDGGGKH